MPRIRSLKPEHKQHRKVGMLSDRQYRLWVGLMTEADDEGRVVAEANQLRALIFPYQPRTSVAHVADALRALDAVGLVRLYRVGDVTYAEFPSWTDHQRVQHPAPSKLPPYQDSMKPHESSRILMSVHGGSEGSGSEGSGGEGIKEGPSVPPHEPSGSNGHHNHHTEAREILAFLNQRASKAFEPTPTNLGFIAARLKAGATPEQCRGVIVRQCRKWATDPKMVEFLRPATLFNATKFDQYVGEQGRPS